MSRRGRTIIVITVIAVASSVAAGLAHEATRHRYQALRPQIRVTLASGCPSTLLNALDVHNGGDDLTDRFTPPHPTTGLVCRYNFTADRRQGVVLYRQARLTAAQADPLADKLNRILTGTETGHAHSCPEDPGPVVTILAFGYPQHSDVDIWFGESGCQALDNGHRGADSVANPPFFQGFVPALEHLIPTCATLPHSPCPAR
jgi:hypothetical protein